MIQQTITRDNWTLTYEETGQPVAMGEIGETFRGEAVTIIGGTPPHKPSSTGRVTIKSIEGGWEQEYFPSVVGCKWIQSSQGATA